MQHGAIFSKVDVRDYKGVCCVSAKDFPEEFELDMVRIKSQGQVGSCVAHVLSSVNEYYNAIQHKDSTEMSTGYIYGNRTTSRHTGPGMVIRDALEAFRLHGNVTKDEFPENVEVPQAIELFKERSKTLNESAYTNRISNYVRLRKIADVKAALLDKKPVVMAMTWYADMEVIDGILTTDLINNDGGHCMLIYGWNEIGWKVQNSWGENWGESGTVIVPYDMDVEEMWAVTDEILDHIIIEKPFNSKFLRIIAKILNFIINSLRMRNPL